MADQLTEEQIAEFKQSQKAQQKQWQQQNIQRQIQQMNQQQQQQQQQQHQQQQQQQQQHQQQQSQQSQTQRQILIHSPQVPIQCGSIYPQQIMLQSNGTLMPITAIQSAGGNIIQMPQQFNNKQNKNVAIAASPQQPMQASTQQPQIILTSQIPPIMSNNQQTAILPNPGKSNEPRGKLTARNASNSVSPKVISQGTQQIQPKSPHIISQSVITSQQGLMSPQFKALPQNSFVTGQSPQTLNNQYFIQAFSGTAGPALIAPNNQHFLPRGTNQSDMVIVAPNSFNPGPFYINQSGMPLSVVGSNATSVISVSSNSSHTATNTTQSGNNKGQTSMIAPAPQHTTPRLKSLKPAINQQSIGTQTQSSAPSAIASQSSTLIITTNHPSVNVPKGKSHKTIQNIASKVSTEKPVSEARQTMTVTLIPQANNPSTTQTNDKIVAQDAITMSSDSISSSKTDTFNQTTKPTNDESKFAQNVQVKNQEKLKNKLFTSRNAPNSALKEKVIQSPNKESVVKKDAATGNDVSSIMSVISENNASQESNTGRKKATNGVIRSNGAKSPQRAIVKPYVNDPNVLTHVIDGFVIQESQSPFPINLDGSQEANSEGTIIESIAEEDDKEDTIILNEQMTSKCVSAEVSTPTPTFKSKIDVICENCFKSIKGTKKTKFKRFCSNACAKKFATNANSSDTSRTEDAESKAKSVNKNNESTTETNIDCSPNQCREPVSKKPKPDVSSNRHTTEAASESMDTSEGGFIPASGTNPNLWNVQDVYDFVRNLPGCQEYADEFKSQEIDGQALILLKEDHLMSAMNMKLGPALKICSRINSIFKAEAAKSQQ